MDRKKKLRIIQLGLLILGSLIIFFTYYNNKTSDEKILSNEDQEKIKVQLFNKNDDNQGDVFFNIEYTGIDLTGNRYILKSKEAISDKNNEDVLNLKLVEAVFYFKDNTTLFVWAEKGIYNTRTLDMEFQENVKAKYEGSELFAQKAEYSNSKSFLTISEMVKIIDFRGTMVADKLLFDIKKQTLNIASFKNGKVNANVNLK